MPFNHLTNSLIHQFANSLCSLWLKTGLPRRSRRRSRVNQNILIMQNEPNFRKSRMFITVISTTNYNEKVALDSWSKRTQTNPNLSAVASAKEDLSASGGRYKKGPAIRQGPWFFHPFALALDGTYVGCFGPLLPLCRLVLHRLVLRKRPCSLCEVRVMDKQILTATVRSDKTISLSLTEPFYFTFFQNFFSLGPLLARQHNFPRIFSQEYAFEG